MLRHFFWIKEKISSIIGGLESASRKIENVLSAQSLSSNDLQLIISDLIKSRNQNLDKLKAIDFNANGNENNEN